MTEPTGMPPQEPPAAPAPAPQPPATPPPAVPTPAAPAPAAPAAPAPQAAPQAPAYGYVPAAGRPGPAPGVFYSGHPARLVAWILDGIIFSIIATIVYFIVGTIMVMVAATGSDTLTGISALAGFVAIVVFSLAWYPYWWSKSGQSPGKKIMHIKVVRADNGELISFGQGIIRLIGYGVSAFVFYLGFLWILVDNRRQGWADKMASTVVIEVP
jgi:uncharacterized RDD family membrane protein YckC